jgi:hypothetical protein
LSSLGITVLFRQVERKMAASFQQGLFSSFRIG